VGGGGDTTHRGRDRDYRPGLDGLRALAIAAVIAFHLGHLAGGNLGVDAFFVLSGWLITWKLLDDLTGTGTGTRTRWPDVAARLRAFWAARGRRLLPASLTVIATVTVVWPLAGIAVRSLRRDVLFATFWSSNWGTITAHGDYWARFGEPSPLTHFWSLAVEEQYYLVWPLLVAVAVVLGRRRARMVVGAVAAALAAASIVTMTVVFSAANPTATYLNTFARAHSLLLGALAAAITTTQADGGLTGGRWARWAAPLAAAGAVAIVAGSDERSTWLFRWGFPREAGRHERRPGAGGEVERGERCRGRGCWRHARCGGCRTAATGCTCGTGR
jgi:peptidoglycan/LPS O-acetylase OafA/YrhL